MGVPYGIQVIVASLQIGTFNQNPEPIPSPDFPVGTEKPLPKGRVAAQI